jgi:protein-S-isoprenylcysteine O-methyltransferase Ste14
MNNRGELWVVSQFLLGGLLFLAPPARAWEEAGWLRLPGILLLLVGSALGVLSARVLGQNLTPFPRPVENGYLVEHGMYRVVRHPIYFSVLLLAVGWSLLRRSPVGMLLALLLFLLFDAKARREERWLAESYPGYPAYQKRVKKLIPWIY